MSIISSRTLAGKLMVRPISQGASCLVASLYSNVESVPDAGCLWANDEDVVTCFQNSRTAQTEALVQRPDVFPKQICPRVDSIEVDKPAKEFYLPGEPAAPD